MSRIGSMSLEGERDFERAMREMDRLLSGGLLEDAVRSGGEILESKMRENAPVDRGDLRDSIKLETSMPHEHAAEAKVGATDIQGKIETLEFASPEKGGRPFIRKSLDENERAIRRAIGKTLREGFQRLGRPG